MDYVTPAADSPMNSDESIQTGFDRSEINQPANLVFNEWNNRFDQRHLLSEISFYFELNLKFNFIQLNYKIK